ncbi:kelch repeat-containing protein [Oligoflexus tunisiensis]|uniref:kelch repeat-containing protein n=1 Tax=Oligoflexus tunisiensis TaxID=708132 RepID=UPI00114CDE54|nr:kelch repeat-containing protein [Oligoflexus tunisiensis]
MRVLTGIILFNLGLTGCFYMPIQSKGKVSTLDESPRLAAPVSATESKAISAYDPNSKVATTIPAPSGALAGSSVTLPAGALAIAAELVVEEAVPLSETSVATSLSINSDIAITPVGSGLIIRPTEDMDLTQPLTIAMPINPTGGLRSWLSQTLSLNSKYYTVFYKYFVNGELKAGAIPTNALQMSDSGSVLFQGYFGAYWLAEVSSPIEEKLEVTTEEPIVNKENVAVVTNTGVVTETEVVKKAAIPPVQWLSVNLSLDANTRSVKATASIGAGRTLSACKVDLFEKTAATSGINLEADASLTIRYTIVKKEAHSLYARFRCQDDQGRQTMSPWSSAVAVSGVVATPVVTQPTHDFCNSTPPELRVIVGYNGATIPVTTRAMTALGSCVYTVDVDSIWGSSFAIQTADGKTSCYTQNLQMGEQAASCVASGATAPQMPLAPGNYTIKLDFKSGATSPRLSLSLQSCELGDLYLLTTNDYYNWPAPVATNRMTHMGGCQYTAQANKINDYSLFVRIQNLNGSYSCGDGTSLNSNTLKTISCGATPGYYMQTAYGPYIKGYNYVLNLGSNMDVNGKPTTTPYLWASEIDLCMDNRYVLGPTSAGNNRQMGVNSFSKSSACTFSYVWLQGPTAFTPFFIGVGEGTEKCGVAPATTPSQYVTLDCSPNAVAIDLQSFVAPNGAWRFDLSTDSTTGKPSSLNLASVTTICSDAFYAVKSGTAGFRPDIQKALTEVSECIYQYDWTPTAADRSLAFIPSHNPATRCGRYPGYNNPAVGGPATDFYCHSNYMLDSDIAFTPTGIVDGKTYKVNLDFRLGYDRAKISIANHTSTSCPDLYVPGLNGPAFPDPANRMTRIGDCNYAYQFKTPETGLNPYFHIAEPGSSIQCGRDSNSGYADPTVSGHSVSMECSVGEPGDFFGTLSSDSYYQILVHYDSPGNSKVSLYSISNNCYTTSTLDGPSAVDHSSSFTKTFSQVDNCVEELLWVPTTTSNAFRLRSDYYGYASYCGLAGGSQPSLSGNQADVLCNMFNVTHVAPFSVAEGISPAQKYLLRFDRSGSPFDPPKVSVSPAYDFFGITQGTWVSGSSEPNAANTMSHPGGRTNAGVWSPAGSQYRYIFGGYGRDDGIGTTFLADLWRYDMANDTWTLLPDGTYGMANGMLASAMGVFHPSNRPSARTDAMTVFDPSGAGKLWLFGGEGLNSSAAVGLLNDLWVYDIGLNQWAMMSGNPADINVQGVMGTSGTPDHTNFPGSRRGAIGWIDASDKLYFFGGFGYTDGSSAHNGMQGQLNDLWVFDPSTDYASSTWTFLNGDNLVNQPGAVGQPSAREGAMSWTDAAGDFWMFGGYGHALDPVNGNMGRLNDLWSYDPNSNTWARRGGPNYIEGWLVNGLRGVSSSHIWPGARTQAAAWQSPDGKFWMFGGDGLSSMYAGGGSMNDLWTFDPSTQQWTWVSGSTQYWGSAEVPAPNHYGEFGPMDMPGTFKPGSRTGAMAFPDGNGNVWIFGGVGYGQFTNGYLNDLWYLGF